MKHHLLTTRPTITRALRGVVASFGLIAAASAMAAPTATVGVVLSTEQFANASTIHATSADRLVHASKSYTYALSATMKGEVGTPIGKLIPEGTSLASFLEGLSPGSSAVLKRKVANPTGALPLGLFNKTISGSKKVSGFGTMKISLTVIGKIAANGEVILDVKNVKLVSSKGVPLGGVKFGKGSKFSVTAAPLVSFPKLGVAANESAGVVTISVSRLVNYTGTVAVDYATADGTGTDGTHYTAKTGTLTFAPGDTKKTFTVNLVNNEFSDGPRTFMIALSNVTGGGFPGGIPATTVTIKNDD